jgi:uncharacterized iron-regulated membrane protein
MRRMPRMTLRKLIFWLHLVAGVMAGTVICVMSVTGVILAFERQIVAFAERHAHAAEPPSPGAPRLGPDALLAKALEAAPEGTPSGLILSATPTAAAIINLGREQTVLVDPYTGAVRQGATTLRRFFHGVTDWHRWLGTHGESREIGRAVTGACNAAFVVMVISGFYLWWPRRWRPLALTAVTVPSLKLRGKPRDWNWHNAVGFWSAPALLLITLTGVVMSYQWANHLLYTLTGSDSPPMPQRPMAGPAVERGVGQGGPVAGAAHGTPDGRIGRQVPAHASLDALVAAATQQAPHWRLLRMRLPQPGSHQATVMIEEAQSWHPYPRSILTLDAATAAVVKWEPYEGYDLGRTTRSWVRPVHTGEAGGLIGQIVAALASAGGAVLVYTGLALAWRRFRQFVRRHRQAGRRKHDETRRHDAAPEDPSHVSTKALS